MIFLTLFAFPAPAGLVESLKAHVGEEIITQRDLHDFKIQLKQKLVPPSLLLKKLYNSSELLKKEDLRLQFLIEREMLAQLAKPAPVNEKSLRTAFKAMQGSLPKKHFAKKLSRAGLTEDSLKQALKASRQIDFLLSQSVLSKISLSDQDIESYHFAKYNKPLFKAFEYEFSSLSFPENKKDMVLKSRRDHPVQNLEELSKSLNLEYKSSRLKEDQISRDFKKELDKLSVSQFSPLMFLGGRYYLLQLKWKSPLISPKEKRKRDQIEKLLFDQKLKQELRQWIEIQKSLFFIKQISP